MKSVNRVSRFAIFGATPDTHNLGVSALYESILAGLSNEFRDLEVVVFDNQLGRRDQVRTLPNCREIREIRFGARGGLKIFRPENLINMLFFSRLGVLGSYFNEGVRLIRSCDAVLDISGGDSFSDIYGSKRFNNMYRQKKIAVNLGKPLVLLPQTYGPYTSPKAFNKASQVTKMAHLAWARDAYSFKILKNLLGSSFEPRAHLLGVDVAFGLRSTLSEGDVPPELEALLDQNVRSCPIAGINVSGLIYNDPVAALKQYGLKVDYSHLMFELTKSLLEKTDCHLVLIPHVVDKVGHYESDLAACQDLAARLGQYARDRVSIAPGNLTAPQVKGLIAKTDWFCGTRMHATIAALSSGVPTATIVYSDKARGVFATCDQENCVFDPRKIGASEIIEGVMNAYAQRDKTRCDLSEIAPRISERSMEPFQRISVLLESGEA